MRSFGIVCHSVLIGSHLFLCAYWGYQLPCVYREPFAAVCSLGVIYCYVLIWESFAAMGLKGVIYCHVLIGSHLLSCA